jgi:hypothetical protein
MKYCPNIEKHIKDFDREYGREYFEFPDGFEFCVECGAKLIEPKAELCKCGKVKTTYKFCPFCGGSNG